jgi:hypothetical protein
MANNDKVVVNNPKQGFFSKMSSSFSGIIVGIIMIVGGIGMLWWNEQNNVKNIKNVKELREQVVDVSSSKVEDKNEGKLIATNGKLDFNQGQAKDDLTNLSVTSPALCRNVEYYQWVEDSETKNDKTTYTYSKEWSSEIIDSDKFEKQDGHINLKESDYKYFGERFETEETLKVGEYVLSNDFKSMLDSDKNVSIPEEGITIPEGYKVYNNKYITNSEDPSSPQVGDVRISYTQADYTDVSVLGKQSDGTITQYTTKNNTNYMKIVKGTTNGTGMINGIESANKMMKWFFRVLGSFLIIVGVGAILGPLTTLIGYIPFLGNIVNSMIGVVSFLVGLSIALLVIAIAWFAARPIISIILIAVIVGLIIALVYFKKTKGQKTN